MAKGKKTVDADGTIRIGGQYAGRVPGSGPVDGSAISRPAGHSAAPSAATTAKARAATVQAQLDAQMKTVSDQEHAAEDRQYLATVWQDDEKDIRERLERIRAERREREQSRTPLTLRERLRSMSRRKAVALAGLLGAGALALTGCGEYSEPEADNVAVCVAQNNPDNPDDDVRVEDDQCGDLDGTQNVNHSGSNAFLWYYLGTMNRTSYPAVGSKVTGGTYTVPAATAVTKSGLDRAGGTLAAGETASSKITSPGGKAMGGKTGGGYGKGSVSTGGLGGGGAKGIGG